MKADTLLGGLLFVSTTVYLMQRNLTHMVVWLGLVYVLASAGGVSHTVSVIAGIITIYVIASVTRETFENEEPKKKEPEGAPEKTDDPHVDVGTTILHAYRNLSPEQIGGMRRDTKELMGLQKELMGSLAEMKPAIEQGAELLKTFSTFFGKNGESII